MSKVMKIVVGNPVEGNNFFGREKEQRQLWRKLETSHLLMLAPRRIGKTSLIKRLAATAGSKNSKVLYCSFAPCQDELACLKELNKAIGSDQQLQNRVSTALGKIKGFKMAGFGFEFKTQEQQWTDVGEALTQALSDCYQADERLIIAVDELPVFILRSLEAPDGERKIRFFLNWFRDLRQTHANHIKWLLAGSIGLDTVTKRLRMGDTINDLLPFPLDAFDQPTAQRLLLTLAGHYELQLSPPVCDYIIKRIGWPVPYYLQVMFDKLVDHIDDTANPVTTEAVDEVFEQLLQPANKSYFDYWRQRLADELGKPNEGYATELLNHISRDPNGVSKASLSQQLSTKMAATTEKDQCLNYLLDVLISDGYLIENKQRYQFRLAWLREYWLRRVAS